MTSRDDALGTSSLSSTGRTALLVVGIAFWGWLLMRWAYDWVINPGVDVSSREPFVPAGPFEAAGGWFEGLAADAGVLSTPLGWLAWLFDFIAFGTSVMPALAAGAWLTIVLTVLGMFFGIFIAVPLSVARVYGSRPLRWLSLAYTELIRGTPLLAQLFVLYYGLPLSGIIRELPGVGVGPVPRAAVWVAVIGFTINSSAYQAEYIRSALQSVDAGQLTAARSVGLSKTESIRHVVLPQGLRYAIPGWTNEFIYLIKYSSLAAFIAVPELFRRARNIGSDTFRYLEMYLIVALFYLALVLTLSVLMDSFEKRVAIPGLGTAADDRE